MQKKNIVFAVALGIVVISALFFFAFAPRPQTVTIERTERGFEPSRVLIKKGDTIVFRSAIDRDFWPASDSHPSHGRYPAFDPKHAITPGGAWEFTFDTAGVWSFHDHLASGFVGKILVGGKEGESLRECLNAIPGVLQPQCWEADLASILQRQGINAAFDAIRHWYDTTPGFQRNCHDVMHLVGKVAYDEFVKSSITLNRPEVNYCGYGFYHGFMEAMLLNKGFGQFEVVRRDYTSLPSKKKPQTGGEGPCYHGIGHAVFDSLEGSLWGNDRAMAEKAIGICESVLSDEYERVRCASGVFNALAIAYGDNKYGLSYPDDDIPLCRSQKKEYQGFCYMEIGHGYLRNKQWSREEELRFIRGMEDSGARDAVIAAYMDTAVRRSIEVLDIPDLAGVCDSFGNARDAESCVHGILIGLRGSGGTNSKQSSIIELCDVLTTPELQTYCRRNGD